MEKGTRLAELVGCNRTTTKETVQCLKAAPAQKLVDEVWNVGLNFLEFPFVLVSRFVLSNIKLE